MQHKQSDPTPFLILALILSIMVMSSPESKASNYNAVPYCTGVGEVMVKAIPDLSNPELLIAKASYDKADCVFKVDKGKGSVILNIHCTRETGKCRAKLSKTTTIL